jgi:hypothetical protein
VLEESFDKIEILKKLIKGPIIKKLEINEDK